MIARLFQSIVDYNYHCLPSPLSFIYSLSILLYFVIIKKKIFWQSVLVDCLVERSGFSFSFSFIFCLGVGSEGLIIRSSHNCVLSSLRRIRLLHRPCPRPPQGGVGSVQNYRISSVPSFARQSHIRVSQSHLSCLHTRNRKGKNQILTITQAYSIRHLHALL